MLGFELDFWDYVTFATLALAGACFMIILLWFAGLPGRIALARNHPDAEAVNLMGWAGIFPTVLPWVQAFIWAFKPTDIIDIRRFPGDEARAIEEDIARLSGKAAAPRRAAAASVAASVAATAPHAAELPTLTTPVPTPAPRPPRPGAAGAGSEDNT